MKRAYETAGFSLIEVTLALGVAAILLLAIFALLPISVKTNRTAAEQTASVDILSAVATDLRVTAVTSPPGSAAVSPRFGINIPANPVTASSTNELFFTTEGKFASALDANTSRYRVTITFPPNGAGTRTATFVDLKATWPAVAAVDVAEGSAEMFVALDRN